MLVRYSDLLLFGMVMPRILREQVAKGKNIGFLNIDKISKYGSLPRSFATEDYSFSVRSRIDISLVRFKAFFEQRVRICIDPAKVGYRIKIRFHPNPR